MKKEELIKENTKLRQTMEQQAVDDIRIREEFAKAFNWYKQKNNFGYSEERELRTPSWEEIFIKVGSLIKVLDLYEFEGNVSKLECAVEDIYKKLSDLTNLK